MLEIKNFSKKYGDKEAVSHLSFVVNDGDIMGFVGKNGAGKTTTLKACMGIITITEGDILLDGISVVKEPIVCKRKMAYVPDTPRLEEYMTGMQYLSIWLTPSMDSYPFWLLATTCFFRVYWGSRVYCELAISQF